MEWCDIAKSYARCLNTILSLYICIYVYGDFGCGLIFFLITWIFLFMSCLRTAIVGPILSAKKGYVIFSMYTIAIERRERERRVLTKNLNDQVADIKKRLCGDVTSSIMIIARFKFDHHRELFNGRPYLWSLLHLSPPLHFNLYHFLFLSIFSGFVIIVSIHIS